MKVRSFLGAAPLELDAALLFLRVAFGLGIALAHGAAKVVNYPRFAAGLVRNGVPLPEVLGPLAMLSELAGGLLIAIGLFTRPAAVCVLVTMLVAAIHIHGGEPFSKRELACAYASVAVVLLLAGPGRYSIDARFGRR